MFNYVNIHGQCHLFSVVGSMFLKKLTAMRVAFDTGDREW